MIIRWQHAIVDSFVGHHMVGMQWLACNGPLVRAVGEGPKTVVVQLPDVHHPPDGRRRGYQRRQRPRGLRIWQKAPTPNLGQEKRHTLLFPLLLGTDFIGILIFYYDVLTVGKKSENWDPHFGARPSMPFGDMKKSKEIKKNKAINHILTSDVLLPCKKPGGARGTRREEKERSKDR